MRLLVSSNRFKGGVHPRYHKAATDRLALQTLAMPGRLVISMSQHLGAPALPAVKAGDTVVGGQVLGTAAGMISAVVHAPTSGRISAVTDALTALGRPAPALVLEPDGADTRGEPLAPLPDWTAQPPKALVARVAAAGIVGMGGAGFPTHVKLAPPSEKPIDTLIINGAECEPYLTGDHRLMVEHAAEIWEGCRILRQVLGARTVRIAVEDNKPEAIAALERAMQDAEGDVALVRLPTIYPEGSEKQQIFAVTGRRVPAGGLPMDVGCLVDNVGTVYAVWDAVVRGHPLTTRTITVSGDAVRPANLLAPIGTPFADLVAACGGPLGRVAKVVAGGPMMGFAQTSLDVTMNKTSSGLLLLSPRCVTQFTSQACIGCGRCVDACPMRLMPSELSQDIEADDIDAAERINVMDCFECGACAYVCPAHRPLVQHMRRAKAAIMLRRRKPQERK